MPLKFNDQIVKKVNWNGSPLKVLKFNDDIAWKSGYDIIYNANGHGVAPAPQEKEEDVPLTLRPFISQVVDVTTGSVISFDPNGGSSTPESVSSTLTATHTQGEWNTDSEGTGTSYASEDTYTANEEATLNAIWGTDESYTDILMPDAIEYSGKTFLNWNSNAEGTGTAYSANTSYNPGTYTGLKGVNTLYAKFGTPTSTVIANDANHGYRPLTGTTWTVVPDSYYTIWMGAYDDEADYSTQAYKLICDGTAMSIADAVAGGYVNTFEYKRINQYYGWNSYGTNVIFNTTAHNGGLVRVAGSGDSYMSGYGVTVVTVLGKNVSGMVMSYGKGQEHSMYTVTQTTYA